jgi:hypothetical protein
MKILNQGSLYPTEIRIRQRLNANYRPFRLSRLAGSAGSIAKDLFLLIVQSSLGRRILRRANEGENVTLQT